MVMQTISSVRILAGATGTGAGAHHTPAFTPKRSFYANGTTSAGAGSATIDIEATNLDTPTSPAVAGEWFSLGTITLTLATTISSDGFTTDAPWRHVRANVTAISGTDATVDVWMGAQVGISTNPAKTGIGGGVGDIRAIVRLTIDTNVFNNTTTAVSFDTEDEDTDNMVDLGSFPTRITFQTAGIYYVYGGGLYFGNATGFRQFWIRFNGTTRRGQSEIPGSSSANGGGYHHDYVEALAGQYVELLTFQNSGGTLQLNGTANTVMGAFRVA